MKKLSYLFLALLGIFCGCTQEEDTRLNPEYVTVPVTITIGADNTLYSRAAPPTEPEVQDHSRVNQVRIITFVRNAGSTGSFIPDPDNSAQNVVCTNEVARGKIRTAYGKEYRVIALGYDTTTGEQNMFTISGNTFDSFILTLKNPTTTIEYGNGLWTTGNMENLPTPAQPEIFYGYCHTGDNNPIISFSPGTQLTGVLHRGMAKVTVTISSVGQGIKYFNWFAMIAETSNTQVNLSDYDNFLTPYSPSHNNLLAKVNIENQTASNVVLSAYILPTTTKLTIRIKSKLSSTDTNYYINDYIVFVSDTSSAENATGVITPVATNQIIQMQRNRQYKITGTYTNLINHETN